MYMYMYMYVYLCIAILIPHVSPWQPSPGDPHSASEHKPGFLTDDELKHLVVEVRVCLVRGVSGKGVTGVKGAW